MVWKGLVINKKKNPEYVPLNVMLILKCTVVCYVGQFVAIAIVHECTDLYIFPLGVKNWYLINTDVKC